MAIKMSLTREQIFPALPTLSEKIKEVTDKIDLITTVKILSGFTWEFEGVLYKFSYQDSDQTNFAHQFESVLLSQQLGAMSETDRTIAYGISLPVALPDAWTCSWNAHTLDGGSKVLTLNIQEFSALFAAGGAHKTQCLADGWTLKAAARACKNESELKDFVDDSNIDVLNRDAKIKMEELNATY